MLAPHLSTLYIDYRFNNNKTFETMRTYRMDVFFEDNAIEEQTSTVLSQNDFAALSTASFAFELGARSVMVCEVLDNGDERGLGVLMQGGQFHRVGNLTF